MIMAVVLWLRVGLVEGGRANGTQQTKDRLFNFFVVQLILNVSEPDKQTAHPRSGWVAKSPKEVAKRSRQNCV